MRGRSILPLLMRSKKQRGADRKADLTNKNFFSFEQACLLFMKKRETATIPAFNTTKKHDSPYSLLRMQEEREKEKPAVVYSSHNNSSCKG